MTETSETTAGYTYVSADGSVQVHGRCRDCGAPTGGLANRCTTCIAKNATVTAIHAGLAIGAGLATGR